MRRSPEFEVEKDFTCEVGITKSWSEANGRRFIQGVASGVAEDRDGERVSKNAIEKMAKQVAQGGVKLTSRHQQDWDTEIGDVVEATHDPKTDELIVKTELPPEGMDPIADKAWNAVTRDGVKLGFSIGGKLKKAFFELTDTNKRRKVLDEIHLRHICLTKTPSYAPSFAQAVAKSFTEDEGIVDEDAFYEADEDEVSKGLAPSSQGTQPSATGDTNAGTRSEGAASMNTDDPDDKEDGEDEPKLDKSPERHLACPNCGHEFAADLPLDGEEQAPDTDSEGEDDNDSTKKSVEQENDMPKSLADTLAELRTFVAKTEGEADAETVEKTEPEVEAAEVEKTEDTFDSEPEVLKIVAASAKRTDDRLEALEASLGEAFGTVAKAIKGIQESILEQPQGRRSVARILPAKGEDEVGKSDADLSATDLLKKQNAENPAYAQYHRS